MKKSIISRTVSGVVAIGSLACVAAMAADEAPQASIAVMSKSALTLGGSARLRAEANDNKDFLGATTDSARFGLMRFRLDLNFAPRNDFSVFVQPQAVRVWGKNEVVSTAPTSGSGAVTGTSTATSGGSQDSRMDLHQGFVTYKPAEGLDFVMGRQILSYGDELLIGALDWNNTGRSFDALKGSLTTGSVKSDLFWSKITERNDTGAGPGDKDLYGLYISASPAEWMKKADLYVLHAAETGTQPTQLTTAYGARLKSSVDQMDYRVEGTFENVKGAKENQVDVEAGYMISAESKLRISAEYFRATAGFDQLYPTTHKWLGYADYFSRRNIAGERVGISSDLGSGRWVSLDYHMFDRTDVNTGAFNISGASYGLVGNEKRLASEFDLIFKDKLNEATTLTLGASWIKPEAYMKDNRGPDHGTFGYAELSVLF